MGPKGKASASVDLGRKVDKPRECRLTLTRHALQDQYFFIPPSSKLSSGRLRARIAAPTRHTDNDEIRADQDTIEKKTGEKWQNKF